jgi:hypothetical protein
LAGQKLTCAQKNQEPQIGKEWPRKGTKVRARPAATKGTEPRISRMKKAIHRKVAKTQRGQPQSKNLNRSKQRKQRRKNFAKNAQLSNIALHAYSQTAPGKRGFATGWLPTTCIRFDQHVGLSLWIARHFWQNFPNRLSE